MDIWEANKEANGLTPHTCNQTGLYECTGAECTWSGELISAPRQEDVC